MAALSAFVLLLHIVLLSKPVRTLHSRLFRSNGPLADINPNEPNPQSSAAGFVAEAKEYVAKQGGATIYAFKITRLVGCLALLGLSLATLILAESEGPDVGHSSKGKHWGKKKKHHKHDHGPLSSDELLQVFAVVNFVGVDSEATVPLNLQSRIQTYTSLLALISVCVGPKWRRLVTRHLAALLLVTFVVYLYRDMWPLATFTLSPKDLSEGWLIWAKVVVLSITAVVIPLLMPRPYIPFNPKVTKSVILSSFTLNFSHPGTGSAKSRANHVPSIARFLQFHGSTRFPCLPSSSLGPRSAVPFGRLRLCQESEKELLPALGPVQREEREKPPVLWADESLPYVFRIG